MKRFCVISSYNTTSSSNLWNRGFIDISKDPDIGKVLKEAGMHIFVILLPIILLIFVIAYIGNKLADKADKKEKESMKEIKEGYL